MKIIRELENSQSLLLPALPACTRRPASNHNSFYENVLLYVAAKASKYSNHTDTTSRRFIYYGSIYLYVYT